MNIIRNKIFIYFQLSAVIITAFLACGYGYSGDLPELGKNTKPPEQDKFQAKQKSPQIIDPDFEFPATRTYFPRIYSNYNIDKYSEYLKDIKQVEPILVNLKQVIKSNSPDKNSAVFAKVNVLNLYVDNLKTKYGSKAEKNYASYKQLIILDKNLTETANYQQLTDKYRKDSRGSLMDKLQDETYLRQKIDKSINSLMKSWKSFKIRTK